MHSELSISSVFLLNHQMKLISTLITEYQIEKA